MAARVLAPTMIALAFILHVACWPTSGQAGLARFYDAVPDPLQERRIPVDDYAMHGPIVDDHEFPRDLREPYPGKSFGPMGPIDGSLPDDVSFRSLSSGQGNGANSMEHLTSHAVQEAGDPAKHAKPEYKIISVEFHRVETPFVIGIWIFFASIAKIGTTPADLELGTWYFGCSLLFLTRTQAASDTFSLPRGWMGQPLAFNP